MHLLRFFEETDDAKSRLVIYNCTSGYPVPFGDICMLEISRLYSLYQHRVKAHTPLSLSLSLSLSLP